MENTNDIQITTASADSLQRAGSGVRPKTRGLPDGSRCEVCGLVGPRANMGWSSVLFDPADQFHLRLVENMPQPFKSLLRPGHKVGFWAHVDGHGCDSETISPAEQPLNDPSATVGRDSSEGASAAPPGNSQTTSDELRHSNRGSLRWRTQDFRIETRREPPFAALTG